MFYILWALLGPQPCPIPLDLTSRAHAPTPSKNSRAGIPHGAFARVEADDGSPHQVGGYAPPRALKHVGVYAFRTAFLEAYSGLPSSMLQDVESLEQLKVMSAGYSIRSKSRVQGLRA